MKTICKSTAPNALTRFAQDNPTADWNDFRHHAIEPDKPGSDYLVIKQLLMQDQGGLCAYCETRIIDLVTREQSVEHFHPKSDQSDPDKNWALDWFNIMAVCRGGVTDDEKGTAKQFPLPQNLSCDAHKNHVAMKRKLAGSEFLAQLRALENPLTISAFPCLFDFDKASGKFMPELVKCREQDHQCGWPQGQTEAKVRTTIEVLNLNCDRLCCEREKVLIQYNREMKKARESNDVNFRRKLADKWFSHRWPSFFTTRRILLGQVAEDWLQSIGYNG